MHILFISSWYPHRKNPTHGIFNRYFAEAASLYNKISVLHVVAEDHIPEMQLVEVEGTVNEITVYYRRPHGMLSAFLKSSRYVKAWDLGMERLERKFGRPDIIQLNVAVPAGLAAIRFANKFHIPIVVNECWSGYTHEDPSYKGLFRKWLTQKVMRSARFVMPTSHYLATAMQSHGLIGDFEIVPNAVNEERFKPGAKNPHEGLCLLHVSSMNDREKNVSGILEAFDAARRKRPNIHLDLVGTGVDEEKYKAYIKAKGLDSNCHFIGPLEGEELVERFQASDALVMFSNYETFGLVNIESFACGKPVIVSDVGAISEYMKPGLGYVVEKGNVNQLAEAMIRMADHRQEFSGPYIRNFAVEQFGYRVIGKRLDIIYREAVAGK